MAASEAASTWPFPAKFGARPEQMPAWRAFALGTYLVATFLLQVSMLVAVWPEAQADGKWMATWNCWFVTSGCSISNDARLIVVVLIAGGVGAMVHALRSFSAHIGLRRLSTDWAWWYVLRPLEGAIIALAFYFVLRGGLLSTNASNDTSAANISVYGVAGLAVLVGMFSHEAVEKLKALAETMFSKAATVGGDTPSQQVHPKPSVTGVTPAEISQGTQNAQITVVGNNFAARSEVRVLGKPRATIFRSSTELVATLTPDDTKQPNLDLRITVMTPPPGGGESEEDAKVRVKSAGT